MFALVLIVCALTVVDNWPQWRGPRGQGVSDEKNLSLEWPVAFDGKLLITSQDGDTFVIKAGPKHEILFTNSVSEPVCASPAISGGKIFIRGEHNL